MWGAVGEVRVRILFANLDRRDSPSCVLLTTLRNTPDRSLSSGANDVTLLARQSRDALRIPDLRAPARAHRL